MYVYVYMYNFDLSAIREDRPLPIGARPFQGTSDGALHSSQLLMTIIIRLLWLYGYMVI